MRLERKKKKVILVSAASIVLFILIYFSYPVIKLEVISRHYNLYGSYVVFPQETHLVDEKPVRTKTLFADYDRKGIKITNVLYYSKLQQLSFGYIYTDNEHEKYGIKLLSSNGQNVPGTLLVSGREQFYTRYLQKLNFLLEEPLRQQATYTILIVDEEGERVGSLDFDYE